MHRIFLVLLIALLPLRGWISDAMATTMLTGQVQQHQQQNLALHALASGVAEHSGHEAGAPSQAFAPADCASHASSQDAHAADSHCDACSACQACHTVALPLPSALMASASTPSLLRRAGSVRFASAEPAPGQKPPIS